MRTIAWTCPALISALCVSVSSPADAAPFLDLTGRVALLDGVAPNGVRVTLGLDLDRDGRLNSFELANADVAADGSYAVSYSPDIDDVDLKFARFVADLLLAYEARGFEALLDDGPLPIVVRFELEGYSTIVKRFTTLTDLPSLDIVLTPLASVHCAADTCMAPDGSVRITGFPGGTGIARAYARAYEPSADQQRFPGTFTDSTNNLLILSGFSEVDLRASSGDAVTALSSPVSVRFQTDKAAWSLLRDLSADSGRVEVPMYSFDEARGAWVSEQRGELQDADGAAIDEGDFASITDGTYPDPVFVAFETSHFSTFNCDAPVKERACVQGRLVTLEGEAVAGVQVSIEGVTYTGTAGAVFTGTDVFFASDLMKSEVSGEDVDGNGRRGETFQARVTASGGVGVFVGQTFDSPTEQGSIGAGKTCKAPDCPCIDLGDVEGEFELPRACEITVNVSFSGSNIAGGSGPLAEGDAVVNAKVTGEISGAPSLPLDDALCGDSACNHGTADADGTTTFVVPVVGDAPIIQVNASLTLEEDGDLHYYSGSVSVTGCAPDDDTLDGTVDVEVDHASLGDFGDFIDSLGAGPAVPSGDGGLLGDPNELIPKYEPPKGCACDVGSRGGGTGSALLSALLVAIGLARRRRR
jgi:MYXO-CTERM domain-containing protein